MPGTDSLIPRVCCRFIASRVAAKWQQTSGLSGEWVEASSDEHGCETRRCDESGYGEEQHGIGAMGADLTD